MMPSIIFDVVQRTRCSALISTSRLVLQQNPGTAPPAGLKKKGPYVVAIVAALPTQRPSVWGPLGAVGLLGGP
jgi:hypothetical protein